MPPSKKDKRHLQDPDLASRYDFDLRKCVHIRLFKRTKNELDIMKKRLDLPLQDIFECLSTAIIDEDPYIISLLNEHRIKKQNKESENFFNYTDASYILDELAKQDPLEDN